MKKAIGILTLLLTLGVMLCGCHQPEPEIPASVPETATETTVPMTEATEAPFSMELLPYEDIFLAVANGEIDTLMENFTAALEAQGYEWSNGEGMISVGDYDNFISGTLGMINEKTYICTLTLSYCAEDTRRMVEIRGLPEEKNFFIVPVPERIAVDPEVQVDSAEDLHQYLLTGIMARRNNIENAVSFGGYRVFL